MPLYQSVLAVVILLAACFGVFLFSRRLYVKKLKAISSMTLDIIKGNFTSRLNIYTKDELSEVARGLNELAHQFQKRIQEITNDKDKLQAVLSSMVEGVLLVGADGKLQHISPNLYKMLELRSSGTTDKMYWEVLWNQEINMLIKEALAQKNALKKDIHVIGPQEHFFSMQISPVLDKQGHLISLVAVFHDITELKKLEKIRSEFVANVSHELKTPLTAIKGFVETLRTTAKEDPKSAERLLEIIAKQTERLENLVNDLLILSSIESKEIRMDILPDSLDKIVQTALQVCKRQIESRHHQVSVQIPANLPQVLVDRQRMEQVFLNLIDNAVKFTPEKGQITIKAEKQNGFIRVDVIDSGIGIAAEHLPRLFERFYRIDKARGRDTGGTGLGLSIVKHIIYAHQGKISVTSTPAQGSTFCLYLPYAKTA